MAEGYCAGKSISEDPEPELEASLYLHVFGSKGTQWFVIRNDSEASEEGSYLRPVLLKNNPNRGLSATASVGSNIYVIGGGDCRYRPPGKYFHSVVAFDSVDYIDTNCPEAGWIKAAPMNHRRMECFAVPVVEKQQICVFQGRRQLENVLDAEVYDIRDGTWRDLNQWPYPEVVRLNCFAVAKNGTDVLLYRNKTKPLIWYDAEDDCYQILREPLCGEFRVHSFTMSDDILYMAGYGLPGRVMALDVYNPNAEPQTISGLVGREELPSATGTRLFVVELAKNKLALICSWSDGGTLFLNCLKIVISKKAAGGGFVFEAKSISPISVYIMDGSSLLNILPVKTEWEEVDRRNIENKWEEEEIDVEEKTEKEEVEVEDEEEGKEKTEKEKEKTKKKKKKKNNTNNSSSGVSRSNGRSGSKNKKKAK